MKKIISVLMILAIALGLLSGCMVRKTGTGATGEAKPAEAGGYSLSTDNSCSCEIEEISGNIKVPSFEKTDSDVINEIKINDLQALYNLIPTYPEKEYSIILSKITDIKRYRINTHYYAEYEYEIEKSYYGNMKKGQRIVVLDNDWSFNQTFFGMNLSNDFARQCVYPEKGQYVLTLIGKQNLSEKRISLDNLCAKEQNYINQNYWNYGGKATAVLFDGEMNNISESYVFKDCENLSDAEKIVKRAIKEMKKSVITGIKEDGTTFEIIR